MYGDMLPDVKSNVTEEWYFKSACHLVKRLASHLAKKIKLAKTWSINIFFIL